MEQENSSADVSDGKEKAKPQMSNQLRESSLHSREIRGKPSTSNHQSNQKKKKTKPRKKKKKEKNKSTGTSESPMIIDDDGHVGEKEIPKKRKGIFLLSLTYL